MTDALPAFPTRPEDGHKGTFGTVVVIGGRVADDRAMIGGPALAARAALRAGCGLAVLAMPQPILNAGLTIAPEATGIALPVDANGRLLPSRVAEALDRHAADVSCIAVGPGLGDGEDVQQMMVRLVAQATCPMVIDADALNALARVRDIRGDFHVQAILTPHPGEFRRLAAPLGIQCDPTLAEKRAEAASELAQRLGCIVVLKGSHTVVSDGLRTSINTTGNVALATGGTGDVLTGIIASFVAQFFRPHLGVGSRQIPPAMQGGLDLYDCARLGVQVQGLAGDLWADDHGRAGLLAGDLLDLIPRARAAMSNTASPVAQARSSTSDPREAASG